MLKYSISEYAKKFNVTPTSVHRWLKRGWDANGNHLTKVIEHGRIIIYVETIQEQEPVINGG